MPRKGDTGNKTYFRSDRFFRVNENEWYFSTREEGDKGPYPSREAAEQALQDYAIEKSGEYNPTGQPWRTPGADR